MLHQLLSCASAKFCQAPPSQQGRLASVPVLGKSKAFFQRLVLYNPAFRALSLGKEAFKYTDLLGETLSLFTLPGIGDWLRSENLLKVYAMSLYGSSFVCVSSIFVDVLALLVPVFRLMVICDCACVMQEGHHAGKGTTYLKTVVEKIAVQLEQLLPTLGRKLRLEIEVPAYVAADIAPLLQSVLVGLVSSGMLTSFIRQKRASMSLIHFLSYIRFRRVGRSHTC